MLIWENAARYDPQRGRPSTWLRTIARTRSIDRLRKHARDQRLQRELQADVDTAEHGASTACLETSHDDARRRALVRRALADLAPEQREPIELAYFAGLSHTEIAEKTGTRLGTVKSRIRLGMAKLRETLAALGDQE